MCILAIETSTSRGSIAILKNEIIVYQDYADLMISHSESLMHRIDNILSSLNIKKNQLSAISVTTGPGSFTGLRIGLATAKGISTGLKIPLISFNTLESLAVNVYGTSKQILSVLDARTKDAYVALFDSSLNMIMDIQCRKYDRITEGIHGEFICVGDVHLVETDFYASKHQNVLTAASQFSLMQLKKIDLSYNQDNIYNLEPLYIKSIPTATSC